MNQTRRPHPVTAALATLSLVGAGFFSVPVRGELATDFVTATNAVRTNYFRGKVGIGTTNPVQILDVTGNLRVTGTGTFFAVTGSGAGLSGIGSNAIADGSITAPKIASNTITTAHLMNGAVVTGKLDMASLDERYLGKTDAKLLAAITNNQPNVTLGANVICAGALAVVGPVTGITAVQVGADPAGAAAAVQADLTSATNTMAQALRNLGPYGDVSMGTYTNRGP